MAIVINQDNIIIEIRMLIVIIMSIICIRNDNRVAIVIVKNQKSC